MNCGTGHETSSGSYSFLFLSIGWLYWHSPSNRHTFIRSILSSQKPRDHAKTSSWDRRSLGWQTGPIRRPQQIALLEWSVVSSPHYFIILINNMSIQPWCERRYVWQLQLLLVQSSLSKTPLWAVENMPLKLLMSSWSRHGPFIETLPCGAKMYVSLCCLDILLIFSISGRCISSRANVGRKLQSFACTFYSCLIFYCYTKLTWINTVSQPNAWQPVCTTDSSWSQLLIFLLAM